MAESNINGKVKGSPLFSKQLWENMNNVYDVMIPTYLFSESWMSKFASDSINLSTISLWALWPPTSLFDFRLRLDSRTMFLLMPFCLITKLNGPLLWKMMVSSQKCLWHNDIIWNFQTLHYIYNFAILFFSVETVSVIVDTDYSRWAVLAQCMKNEFGQPAFFNSRILSRTRSLSAADMDRARAAIHENHVNGQYTYTVSQDECY